MDRRTTWVGPPAVVERFGKKQVSLFGKQSGIEGGVGIAVVKQLAVLQRAPGQPGTVGGLAAFAGMAHNPQRNGVVELGDCGTDAKCRQQKAAGTSPFPGQLRGQAQAGRSVSSGGYAQVVAQSHVPQGLELGLRDGHEFYFGGVFLAFRQVGTGDCFDLSGHGVAAVGQFELDF